MPSVSQSSPVNLSAGLPETVLPPPSPAEAAKLGAALAAPEGDRRERLAAVAAANPRYLEAWGRLGDHGRDPIESYAYYRVGYHRGLDALRGAGWRGSGYVRWRHEGNRGFLMALDGLRRTAAAIGETEEADRCAQFLAQLDPETFAPPGPP